MPLVLLPTRIGLFKLYSISEQFLCYLTSESSLVSNEIVTRCLQKLT